MTKPVSPSRLMAKLDESPARQSAARGMTVGGSGETLCLEQWPDIVDWPSAVAVAARPSDSHRYSSAARDHSLRK